MQTNKKIILLLFFSAVLITILQSCKPTSTKEQEDAGEAAENLSDDPEVEYAYILTDNGNPITPANIDKISGSETGLNDSSKRVDSIYINKMFGRGLDSKIFFIKDDNSITLNLITRDDEHNYMYVIEKFYLGGNDSVISVFFHNDDQVSDRPILGIISKNTVHNNESPLYYTDIFQASCGMHWCSASRLEEDKDIMQTLYSSVKKYEDFLPAWKKWKQSKPAGFF